MSYPWKPGMRCKLVRPRLLGNYGRTGVLLSIEEGHTVYGIDDDGRYVSAWADCKVAWDDGHEWTYQTLDQLVPLTPPKPDLAKWKDMPCNPDGTYKEEVLIHVWL